MRLAAIIVAAGSSTRVGCDKVFAPIDGRPVLQYSLEAFEQTSSVDEIVVVCQETMTEKISELVSSARVRKVRAIVPGGKRRQDSVAAGLRAISADFVAVHDAARPLITAGEIERVFAAARKYGAAVLAAPVTDTLKLGDEFVRDSIERENVFAMQTPQIFSFKLLKDAYQRVASERTHVTDEVSAVQNFGAKVAIVPARDANMKITFANDLPLAEFILQRRSSSVP